VVVFACYENEHEEGQNVDTHRFLGVFLPVRKAEREPFSTGFQSSNLTFLVSNLLVGQDILDFCSDFTMVCAFPVFLLNIGYYQFILRYEVVTLVLVRLGLAHYWQCW
jgi:hypothetical protein